MKNLRLLSSLTWRYVAGLVSAIILITIVLLISRKSTADLEKSAAKNRQPWSVQMVESEMSRRGDSFLFNEGAKSSWVYETGFFLKGVEQVWRQTGDDKYFAYLKAIVDSYVEPDGNIKTYDLQEYNIDHLNCGKLLLSLYGTTRDEKYKKAAFLLMQQLETHPRTKEGGFWHKQIYPWQMWLDGIYMGTPFYAEFAKLFNKPESFDDVANQIIFIADHTQDLRTGLFYHGWDESRQQRWADPITGRSPNFWGRAMGWYAMGIVDVLDFLPPDHAQRQKIISIFHGLAEAVVNYQDRETGLWYQVLDQGKRQGNFLEASASSMFVYALAKGIRNGYLGNEFMPAVEKGYQGIIAHLIKVDGNGMVNLTQICRVAGLGGNPYRDGSYEYYISTPIDTNDLKGVGAFILASVEIEKSNRHGKSRE
jgi:unsaturated rhamnogalacturonyl hydrolase